MEITLLALIGLLILCIILNAFVLQILNNKINNLIKGEESRFYDLEEKLDKIIYLVEGKTKDILENNKYNFRQIHTNIESTMKFIISGIENQTENQTDNIKESLDKQTNDIMEVIGNAVYNIKSQLPKRKVKKDTTSEK